jgi:Trypsin
MPVCLWPTFDFNFQALEAAGWGLTSLNGNKAEKLQKAFLDAIPTDLCKESYPTKRRLKNGLIDSQICAESTSVKVMDTCKVRNTTTWLIRQI